MCGLLRACRLSKGGLSIHSDYVTRTFWWLLVSRRKALEEAVLALDIDADPPNKLNVGSSWAPPSIHQHPEVGIGFPRVGQSSGRKSPTRRLSSAGIGDHAGMAETWPPSVNPSGARLVATSLAQSSRRQQDSVPRPCGACSGAAAGADARGSDRTAGFCRGFGSDHRSTSRQLAGQRSVSIDHSKGVRFSGEEGPVCGTALKGLDVANVGGPASCPSPVERVLTRRKRRRRANLRVSSALLFSASNEDEPVPPVVVRRPCPPLATSDEGEDDSVPGLCQTGEALDLR